MIYVVDTNSFRELERYYRDVFPTFWGLFEAEVHKGDVVSVREVWRELEACPETSVITWCKANLGIFKPATAPEAAFVGEIFAIPHFEQLISAKAQTTGQPVADPFLIAAAQVCGGTVVTQESQSQTLQRYQTFANILESPARLSRDF